MIIHARAIQRWVTGVLLVGGMAGSATGAAAQTTPAGRFFVNVNFGATVAGKSDDTRFDFPLYGESANVDVSRTIGGGGFPDVTGGMMLTRRLGVAVNFQKLTDTADGDLSAALPDPAFFDTPHTVAGTVESLQHGETWVAVLLAYPLLSRPGFDLTVLGGPAVAYVTHEVATNVAAPTTSSVALTLEKQSRSLWGGQIGVDVRRMLTRRLGLGGYVRYNGAKGHLGAYNANLGGLQVGGGVRLRF